MPPDAFYNSSILKLHNNATTNCGELEEENAAVA